jgi:hypothetical protein
MVEVLSVLALATKDIKRGRISKCIPPIRFVIAGHSAEKFVMKLLGENKTEAVLQRLSQLTDEESRMTAALTLRGVHDIGDNMKVVMNGAQFLLCPDPH